MLTIGKLAKGVLVLLALGAAAIAEARGGIEILDAYYGAGRRYCTATDVVAQECDFQSRCSIAVDNNLCGDPARGVDKTLDVHYRCRGRTYSVSAPEYRRLDIVCDDYREPPEDRYGIRIHEASYGIRNRRCDARPAVRDMCSGQRECSFRVDNELCGDPARGVDKNLRLEYSCGYRGEMRSMNIGEYGYARLNCGR